MSLAGCNFDNSTQASPADGAQGADGGMAPDAPEGGQLHLLLSEVKSTIAGTEFIEIYNPSGAPIALDDYYLSDDEVYASLPQSLNGGPTAPVSTSDFLSRFPAGASIGPGEVLVVGVNASVFVLTFGFSPDFKIGPLGSGQDMRDAYGGSVGSVPSLTDTGEGVALFYWDGASDLVTDVDLLVVGTGPSSDNILVNKTGLSIDGPDTGDMASAYKTDLSTMGPFARATSLLESHERQSPEVGFEIQVGTGNGRFGHDESSEDSSQTWRVIGTATPGVVAPTLVSFSP